MERQWPITSLKTLGSVIRHARREKGLSQAELGKLVNIAQNRISSLETGRVTGTFETLLRVLSALDLEIILKPKSKTQTTDW